ncbi:MAG TPA: hypothetical protein VEV61_09005 [Streptosporangiaceae bacterium]|nr:hypothetical protein [Streptosporangiaceae bacterium]
MNYFGRIICGVGRPKQVRLYLYVRASAPHSGSRAAAGELCMHETAIIGVVTGN